MDELIGMPFNNWLQLLKDNRFAIDLRNTGKAAFLTFASLFNSMNRKVDDEIYQREIVGKVEISEPVFILGHWRSGTTFLHNILSQDQQFTYATIYQTSNPLTFLKKEDQAYKRWENVRVKRPMDNINFVPTSPGEDEFAVSALSLCSPLISWSFPKRESFYDRYITFKQATAEEINRWQEALLYFLRKITWKTPRRLLLKSPPHTARIYLLLRLFPGARFINIYRNPYEVFQSTRRLFSSGISRGYLQAMPTPEQIDTSILKRYNLLYDGFFEDAPAIPPGQFCEVKFEDLEKDMFGEVRKIYECLNLPDFNTASLAISQYIDSINNYQKNTHEDLPEQTRQQIAKAWERSFDCWKYPTILSSGRH